MAAAPTPEFSLPAPASSTTSPPARAVSRRRVMLAAGWSVPAITVAAAAPAFASSNDTIQFEARPAQWDPDAPGTLQGELWFTSDDISRGTPALTLVLDFPESWVAAAQAAGTEIRVGYYNLDAVGQVDWGSWQADSALALQGEDPVGQYVASSTGTFTFIHAGGFPVDPSDGPYFDFRYSATIDGVDLSGTLDELTATVHVTGSTPPWTIYAGSPPGGASVTGQVTIN